MDEAEEARKSATAYNQRKNDDWNKKHEAQNTGNQQRNSGPGDNILPLCGYCETKHPRGECPAYRQECYGCGKLHHYARVCNRRERRERDRTPRRGGREDNYARRSDRNAKAARDTSPKEAVRRARVAEDVDNGMSRPWDGQREKTVE